MAEKDVVDTSAQMADDDHQREGATSKKYNTIEELGWTEEQARLARLQFAAFLEDWDDPDMEVYDEL